MSSGAFYDATPYRFGRAGAWTYYLLVQPKSCAGGVTAVRFTVGGVSEDVRRAADILERRALGARLPAVVLRPVPIGQFLEEVVCPTNEVR